MVRSNTSNYRFDQSHGSPGPRRVRHQPHVEDDSLRIYLQRIATYPLLTKEEEQHLGQRMERNRATTRRLLLMNPALLGTAIDALQRVVDRDVRVDRILEVATDNRTRRRQLDAALETSLPTLRFLHERITNRTNTYSRSVSLRRKAAKLVIELDFRTDVLDMPVTELEMLNSQMRQIYRRLRKDSDLDPSTRRKLVRELTAMEKKAGESTTSLSRR